MQERELFSLYLIYCLQSRGESSLALAARSICEAHHSLTVTRALTRAIFIFKSSSIIIGLKVRIVALHVEMYSV
jgi:hypothetical protein